MPRAASTNKSPRRKRPTKAASNEPQEPIAVSEPKVDETEKTVSVVEESPRKESAVHASPVQPKEEVIHYEFGGPVGALGVIIGLPLVTFALYYTCTKDLCLNFDTFSVEGGLQQYWSSLVQTLPSSLSDLITPTAVKLYVGWMVLHVVMERLLPGEEVEGTLIKGRGKEFRLTYFMSGHLQFWLTLVLLFHGVPLLSRAVPGDEGAPLLTGMGKLVDLTLVYDHYPELIAVSVLGALLLSFYLYLSSFLPNQVLAKGGQTGNPIYDFFIGRELNPRALGGMDLKEFCELRPGLIGWFVINLAMAAAQCRRNGGTGVSGSMALTVLFQGLYVWDALYNEKAILTTMDITTDGFGFMLAFGDLAWVPFIYSLQARYLVDHDPGLSPSALVVITAIHFAGYYIFRAANSQKDSFRKDPNAPAVAHLKYMKTRRGTRLLVSGWWGAARKINYTGDWLVTLSWCLLCGWQSPLPYFQAVYFLVLLVHRAARDDHFCAEKYGDDWQEYKRQVPYLFIPFVW